MNRPTALAFGCLFVAAAAAVILEGGAPKADQPVQKSKTEPGDEPGAADKPNRQNADGGGAQSAETRAEAGDFATQPDGAPVPELPSDAPKSVGFGVILFSYRGAQLASKDAPPKAEALGRATALLEEAKRDFEEAVKRGDPGSTANAGQMPRGILEPSVEYSLFTLAKGAVHGVPIDTPRGYWLVRRID
jgi:hypothetical protein